MIFLQLFSWIGIAFGDLFAVLAVIGAVAMLLTTFADNASSRPDQLARSGISGLILAGFGQISMLLTGTVVDKVGFVLGLTPELVNSLLLISLGILVLRHWLRSNFYRYI